MKLDHKFSADLKALTFKHYEESGERTVVARLELTLDEARAKIVIGHDLCKVAFATNDDGMPRLKSLKPSIAYERHSIQFGKQTCVNAIPSLGTITPSGRGQIKALLDIPFSLGDLGLISYLVARFGADVQVDIKAAQLDLGLVG